MLKFLKTKTYGYLRRLLLRMNATYILVYLFDITILDFRNTFQICISIK